MDIGKFSSDTFVVTDHQFVGDLIELEKFVEPFSYKTKWGVAQAHQLSPPSILFHPFGLENADSWNLTDTKSDDGSSSSDSTATTDSVLADLFSELDLSPRLDKLPSIKPEKRWNHNLQLLKTLAETQMKLSDSNCQLLAARNEFNQLESDSASAIVTIQMERDNRRKLQLQVQEQTNVLRLKNKKISQLEESLSSNCWEFNTSTKNEIISLRKQVEVGKTMFNLSEESMREEMERNDKLETRIDAEVTSKLQLQSLLAEVRSILSIEDVGDISSVVQSLTDLNELIDEYAFEFSMLFPEESKSSKFTPEFLEIVGKHSNLSSAGFMLTRARFRVNQTIDTLILPIVASAILTELDRLFQVFSPALFVVNEATDLKLREVFSDILSKDPRQALNWRRLTLKTLNQLHHNDINTVAERSCDTVIGSLRDLAIYFDRTAEQWESFVWCNLSKNLLAIFQDALSWQKQHQEGYLSCRFDTFVCTSGTKFDDLSMELETAVKYKNSVVIASTKFGLLQTSYNSQKEAFQSKILLKSVVLTSGRDVKS